MEVAGTRDLESIRPAIASARRILLNEKIVFQPIPKYGLRRLSDSEKVQSTERFKTVIRRAATRGIKRLDSVDKYELLSPADQMTARLNRMTFDMMRTQAAKPRSTVSHHQAAPPTVASPTVDANALPRNRLNTIAPVPPSPTAARFASPRPSRRH
jgi:hypothetical protein